MAALPITVAPGRQRRDASRAAMAFRQPPSSRPTTSPRQATIHPGQQLVIPRYNTSPVATAVAARRRSRRAPLRPRRSAGDEPGRQSGRARGRAGRDAEQDFAPLRKPISEIAKANNIQPTRQAQDRRPSRDSGRAHVGRQAQGQSAGRAGEAGAVRDVEASRAAPSASVYAAGRRSATCQGPSKSAEAAGALPKFRWPANGRVIAGFGPTPTASRTTASISRCRRARR